MWNDQIFQSHDLGTGFSGTQNGGFFSERLVKLGRARGHSGIAFGEELVRAGAGYAVRLNVSWTETGYVSSRQVKYRLNADPWIDCGLIDGSSIRLDVPDSGTVMVVVVGYDGAGQVPVSATASASHVIAGRYAPPPAVTGFAVSALADGTRVVGIDEAQFFDGAVVEVVERLALRGIRVVVAGLGIAGFACADALLQREADVIVIDDNNGPQQVNKAQILEVLGATVRLGTAATVDALDAHDGHVLTKGHAGTAILPALLSVVDGAGADEPAAANTTNLATNPVVSGMPANANRNRANNAPTNGRRRPRPAHDSKPVASRPTPSRTTDSRAKPPNAENAYVAR